MIPEKIKIGYKEYRLEKGQIQAIIFGSVGGLFGAGIGIKVAIEENRNDKNA